MNLGELPNFKPVYEELSAGLHRIGAEPLCARDHVLLSLGMAAGALHRDRLIEEVEQYQLTGVFATVIAGFNKTAKEISKN